MKRRKGRNIRPCSVDGCDLMTGHPGTARGLCSKHYARRQRHGDPLKGERKRRVTGPACMVPGCDREARVRGCCRTHSQRFYRNDGDPLAPSRRPPRWTPAEDARLLDLPVDPKTGAVVAGYLTDLADRMMDRTLVACRSRLYELRNARARHAAKGG